MKTLLFHCFVLLTLVLICTACPYETNVPIDTPKFPVEQRFLGTWRLKSGSKNYFRIARHDTRRYRVEEYAYNAQTGNYQIRYYAGHITYLKGVPFLNIKVLEGKEDTAVAPLDQYYLYKINVLGSREIELIYLSEKLPKFSSSSALRNHIIRDMMSNRLYQKAEIYFRE
jgi:hypothetical protein